MIEMDMPKIDVTENEERSYAKIVVEPLEKGFGLTIGNCLRRILLSALPGAAAQGIKFMDGPRSEGGRDRDHPEPEAPCDQDQDHR